MKKICFLSLLVMSASSFAMTPSTLSRLLQSPEAQNMDIQKIEVLKTYKCFGSCNDVKISGFSWFGEAYVTVNVSDTQEGFIVQTLERSR